eukprot:m.1015484 g.1015484  ORF g.1015484 m.1015484 type:complete len:1017 (-) comp24077_c0_seq14:2878-5928(-)
MMFTLRCVPSLLLLLCAKSKATCYFPPDTSGHVTIPDTVSSIGFAKFQSCTSLQTVTVSDSVSTILDNAFSFCTSLTMATFSSSVKSIGDDAFIFCTSLTTLIFSDSVSSIGAFAFFSCTSLVTVTIPTSVTSIGYMAFGSCTSLTTVNMLTSASLEYSTAFPSCFGYGLRMERSLTSTTTSVVSCLPCANQSLLTIPDSVSVIEYAAFTSCTSLTTVILPRSFLLVNGSAFPSCFGSGLQARFSESASASTTIHCLPCANQSYIRIPDTVLSIGNFAFASCTELSTLTIPNSVTSIGRNTFILCTSVETLMIPDSVSSIGGYAFYGCIHLSNISIPTSVSFIGENSFQFCFNLVAVAIPDSINSISAGIFTACTTLGSITIPDSVTEIGMFSFVACTSLRSVKMGNAVSVIGRSAFQKCSALSEVVLPDALTYISESAFQFCTSLTEIAIPDEVDIADSAFYGCVLCGNAYIQEDDDQDDGYVVSINHMRATFHNPVLSSYSFFHCYELKEVHIADTVQLIRSRAISFSVSVNSIEIPESVHTIEETAFQGCLHLSSARIPPSVSVSASAFFGCECPQSMYTSGSAIQNCTRGFLRANVWVPYTTCSTSQFQSKAGSYTADVQCTQLRECQSIAVGATATTDRVCGSNTLSLLTGAGLGVAVETCVIVVICLILWRVYKRKKSTEKDLQLHALLLEDERAERRSLYAENVGMKRAWEIYEDDLQLEDKLATGAFGSVWRATWGHIVVAVKMLRHHVDDLDPLAGEDFHKEVAFMQKIKHPHLVLFYGAGVTHDNVPYLVVEYMQLGSMRRVLLSDRLLPSTTRLQMVMDIASGMRHLHSLGCMHRDLKSDNCLVGDNMRVKVADFGDSRLLLRGVSEVAEYFDRSDGSASLTRGVGTPLWMAPELMERGTRYGREIDVYSFGIIMWEIVVRQTPWEQDIAEEGVRFSTALRQAVLDGQRPSLPMQTDFPKAYIELMKRSWSGAPMARPSFVDIAEELSNIVCGADRLYTYASLDG